MEKIVKVKNKEYYYYGSYNDINKAMVVANIYKDESKFTIKKRTTNILVSDVFDLYFNKISPLSNGVVIL